MKYHRTPISLPGDPLSTKNRTIQSTDLNERGATFGPNNGHANPTTPFDPITAGIALLTLRFPTMAVAVIAAKLVKEAMSTPLPPAVEMIYAQDRHDVTRRDPKFRDAMQQGVDRFEHRERMEKIEGRTTAIA